jgi:hypothetical protein
MNRWAWLCSIALAVAFLVFYLSGLPVVPFHPDESSQISLSGDFSRLFLQHDLESLAWASDRTLTPDMRLRLLDAPATRYLIGLSDWLHGFSPADLNTDWVWWQSWDENVAAGHMPGRALLLASRVPAGILSALAVALLFWIVYEARGLAVGVIAALLLGLNPLVLLHGRRAMAEGALLFFSLLAVWGIGRLASAVGKRGRAPLKLGLLGLGAGALIGLAVSSKQSGLALLPVALAAVTLPGLRPDGGLSLRRRLLALFTTWLGLGLGCGLAFWALNPALYREPVGGLQAMISSRAELLREQTVAQSAALPETITPDPVSRLQAAVREIYFRPPAIWDVPIYRERQLPEAEVYFAQPFSRLTGGWLWGALLAGLGVVGLVFGGRRLWQARLNPSTGPEQTLWWWTTGVWVMVLLTTPFDWQRYFMWLVPPACVFAALGLELFAGMGARLIRKRNPAR